MLIALLSSIFQQWIYVIGGSQSLRRGPTAYHLGNTLLIILSKNFISHYIRISYSYANPTYSNASFSLLPARFFRPFCSSDNATRLHFSPIKSFETMKTRFPSRFCNSSPQLTLVTCITWMVPNRRRRSTWNLTITINPYAGFGSGENLALRI